MTTISCTRLLVDDRLTGPGSVTIADGRIVRVRLAARPPSSPPPADVVLDGGTLTAGMVDLQVNGAAGVDLAGADADGWATVAGRLAAHGVTAFCPTFTSAPVTRQRAGVAATAAARDALAQRGRPVARVLGAHLEGPFLSPARRGAHDPAALAAPTPAALDALLDGLERDALRIVTLAPELDGAPAAVARLRAAGIAVALGHSDATAAQTARAADAGATLVTHLFNAQRPFAHREPGIAGRALVDPRLVCGLIADLHHVAPDAIRLAFAAAGERIALVSDAVAAAGLRGGRIRIGTVEAVARPDGPPRLADGTLAGAATLLDAAVRNVVALGVPPARALLAATAVPAAAVGDDGGGRLAPGRRADLVWWDDELRVRAVWIGGERVAPAAGSADEGGDG